jgi:Uncharacterized protein conserved in bacteria (DUF2330)
MSMRRPLLLCLGLLATIAAATQLPAACCYFSARDADILQPGQRAFLTWDPTEKIETFTVQPKFEGSALDFGMVIPTPTQPKLHEMPRDFFKHLAVYSIMKHREFPQSKLLPVEPLGEVGGYSLRGMPIASSFHGRSGATREPAVKVLEAGVVGSLDYKIIEAGRADDLYQWLKDHKYTYSGDEATLNHYIQKRWLFTVMKIDTMQMKRNRDGTYTGEVTPTRFQFASEKLVYPLKITQISVKDKTEALFYIQAPTKVDLKGDFSYQFTWVPMLWFSQGCAGGIPGGGEEWLKMFRPRTLALTTRAKELGWEFVRGKRPQPGKNGYIPTTMEWARKLTAADVGIVKGTSPYSEKVPDVDEGFTRADVADPKKAEAVYKVIRDRLDKCNKERPIGYLVREAPVEDVRALQQLAGHVREGSFITKFRKIFLRAEMNDDLEIVPARYGDVEDSSEYEELLPVSPP